MIIRKNFKTDEVVNEYELRDDEFIIMKDHALYIVTQDELDKLQSGEIEEYELSDSPYELESDEIFIIK